MGLYDRPGPQVDYSVPVYKPQVWMPNFQGWAAAAGQVQSEVQNWQQIIDNQVNYLGSDKNAYQAWQNKLSGYVDEVKSGYADNIDQGRRLLYDSIRDIRMDYSQGIPAALQSRYQQAVALNQEIKERYGDDKSDVNLKYAQMSLAQNMGGIEIDESGNLAGYSLPTYQQVQKYVDVNEEMMKYISEIDPAKIGYMSPAEAMNAIQFIKHPVTGQNAAYIISKEGERYDVTESLQALFEQPHIKEQMRINSVVTVQGMSPDQRQAYAGSFELQAQMEKATLEAQYSQLSDKHNKANTSRNTTDIREFQTMLYKNGLLKKSQISGKMDAATQKAWSKTVENTNNTIIQYDAYSVDPQDTNTLVNLHMQEQKADLLKSADAMKPDWMRYEVKGADPYVRDKAYLDRYFLKQELYRKQFVPKPDEFIYGAGPATTMPGKDPKDDLSDLREQRKSSDEALGKLATSFAIDMGLDPGVFTSHDLRKMHGALAVTMSKAQGNLLDPEAANDANVTSFMNELGIPEHEHELQLDKYRSIYTKLQDKDINDQISTSNRIARNELSLQAKVNDTLRFVVNNATPEQRAQVAGDIRDNISRWIGTVQDEIRLGTGGRTWGEYFAGAKPTQYSDQEIAEMRAAIPQMEALLGMSDKNLIDYVIKDGSALKNARIRIPKYGISQPGGPSAVIGYGTSTAYDGLVDNIYAEGRKTYPDLTTKGGTGRYTNIDVSRDPFMGERVNKHLTNFFQRSGVKFPIVDVTDPTMPGVGYVSIGGSIQEVPAEDITNINPDSYQVGLAYLHNNPGLLQINFRATVDGEENVPVTYYAHPSTMGGNVESIIHNTVLDGGAYALYNTDEMGNSDPVFKNFDVLSQFYDSPSANGTLDLMTAVSNRDIAAEGMGESAFIHAQDQANAEPIEYMVVRDRIPVRFVNTQGEPDITEVSLIAYQRGGKGPVHNATVIRVKSSDGNTHLKSVVPTTLRNLGVVASVAGYGTDPMEAYRALKHYELYNAVSANPDFYLRRVDRELLDIYPESNVPIGPSSMPLPPQQQ